MGQFGVSTMSKKLFVANLPFSASEEDLRELFSSAGTVSDVHIAHDRQTGRPRGFGFVEMSSSDEAQNAIETLDGADLQGRPIAVKEANPPAEKGSGGGYGDRGGDRRPRDRR